MTDDDRAHGRLLGTLTALVIGAMWLVPFREALWVDELLTFWIVEGGFGEVASRATEYHNASPLYFWIAWLFRVAGDGNEIVLRIPSLVSALAAAYLVYRIALRVAGREAARLALLAFAATGGMAFAAGDARPYAPAIAALAGSLLALLRWVDEQRTRDGLLAVALAAAIVWLHFLFAIALLAHAAVLIARRRDLRAAPVAAMAAGFVLLLAPLVPQLASIASRRGSLTIPQPIPTFETLATLILPASLLLGAITGVAVARMRGPLGVEGGGIAAAPAAMLAAWGVAAPLVPFLVSQVSETRFSAPRYYFFSAPAFAIALGWLLSRIAPARARRVIAVSMVVFALLAPAATVHSFEDWRAAARTANAIEDLDLILIDTHLVEARDPEWLADPVRRSYLLAPLSRYPIAGTIEVLPYDIEPETQGYLEAIAAVASGLDRVLVIQRRADEPFVGWLSERLPHTVTRVQRYGHMTLDLFTR